MHAWDKTSPAHCRFSFIFNIQDHKIQSATSKNAIKQKQHEISHALIFPCLQASEVTSFFFIIQISQHGKTNKLECIVYTIFKQNPKS